MSGSPIRMVVTGREGQVVTSLRERGLLHSDLEIIAVGRPMLDLADPTAVSRVLCALKPDVIVSAAAYTAVDLAETETETARLINGLAPGAIGEAAALLNVPVVHLSTDYVFDGEKPSPYLETDPVNPLGAYGRSKREGEVRLGAATGNHVILRTAWIYSPFGRNFVKTMLHAAGSRDSLSVVDDQIGNPTSALDIADAVIAVSRNLLAGDDRSKRGIFHLTGTGDASWADLALHIFDISRSLGGPSAEVTRISTRDYPTPARRPANSRLDCQWLADVHGIRLPDWRSAVAGVVSRCLAPD